MVSGGSWYQVACSEVSCDFKRWSEGAECVQHTNPGGKSSAQYKSSALTAFALKSNGKNPFAWWCAPIQWYVQWVLFCALHLYILLLHPTSCNTCKPWCNDRRNLYCCLTFAQMGAVSREKSREIGCFAQSFAQCFAQCFALHDVLHNVLLT